MSASAARKAFMQSGILPFNPEIALQSPYVRKSEVLYEEFDKTKAKGAEVLSSSQLTCEDHVKLIGERFNQQKDGDTIIFTQLMNDE